MSRRETVQMRVWRLRSPIRQLFRPQEAFTRAHLRQALQLQDPRLRQELHTPQLATQTHEGAQQIATATECIRTRDHHPAAATTDNEHPVADNEFRHIDGTEFDVDYGGHESRQQHHGGYESKRVVRVPEQRWHAHATE